jgi:hypothetical protein
MRENSFEHHTTTQQGPIVRFEWNDPQHGISWKVGCKGRGALRVQSHTGRPYLSMTVGEHYEGANGATTGKEASITLDVEHGRALFEWLKKLYEPAAEVCTYPRCKCIVQTSTSQPEPTCPHGLERAP